MPAREKPMAVSVRIAGVWRRPALTQAISWHHAAFDVSEREEARCRMQGIARSRSVTRSRLEKDETMFEAALRRLDDAATHLRIDPDVIEKLKYPKEMLAVRLMIRMDDGSRRSFLAWRCRYDDTRGPHRTE